jgi:cytochrome c-type biogenesis protein CcmH
MDLESWNQIGMFWKSMRQFGIAEAAFRRVLFHEPDNSTAIVELAETLLFGSGQPHLPTEGWHLLEGLLEREPENQKALWLSGFNAMQLGDSASAIAYWSRLEVLLPEGSVKQQVQNQLRQARNMPMDDVHAGLLAAAGNDPETGAPDSAVGDPAEPTRAVAGQARADSEPAADAKAPAASTSVESGTSDPVTVEVDVSIAPELAQRLSGQETVFVFARAVNGPPAPLAVKRFSVRQLPTRVMLSEADAMAAGLTLATFPQVQIVARISRSGGVIANPGDIEGGTEPLDPRTTSRVAVVVDRIVGDG